MAAASICIPRRLNRRCELYREAGPVILYSLLCDKDHDFDAWFKSSDDFDKQAERGLVSCPMCGSTQVSKSLMAPAVSTSKRKQNQMVPIEEASAVTSAGNDSGGAVVAADTPAPVAPVALSNPDPKMAGLLDAMRKLKTHITENADYVGQDFAEEARKIHYGEIEERGIYGETTLKEAESLRDEGIEVQPIPVLPDETN